MVDPFFAYKIAHQGLKKQKHRFHYNLDDSFFKDLEYSQIQGAAITAAVDFDNTQEPYIIDIEIDGHCMSDCDKCAAIIPLKIRGDFRLYIKFTGQDSVVDADEMDIIFISRDEPVIDMTQYLYEFVQLSMPIARTCEKPFETDLCDMEVGRILRNQNSETTQENIIDPRWSALNKLKDKK